MPDDVEFLLVLSCAFLRLLLDDPLKMAQRLVLSRKLLVVSRETLHRNLQILNLLVGLN